MWKSIIQAVVVIAIDLWRKWRDFRRVEDTRDAQRKNDDADRGSAADVAARMRQRAERDGL